jgi:hypothetical protein
MGINISLLNCGIDCFIYAFLNQNAHFYIFRQNSLKLLLWSLSSLRVRVRVTLPLTVYCQSLRPGDMPPWDSQPAFFFFNWTLAVIVLMLYLLWREDGSVVYSCCLFSPAQSFLGQSPAGLMTTFYCLRFKTSSIPEGQVPVFISSRNRVAELYPQALGSPLVPSYESQRYSGGIWPRFHTGFIC